MESEIISAVGGLATAVVAQTVIFSPESRRVRRLKAYLEVRTAMTAHGHPGQELDELIKQEVRTEIRARARARRQWSLVLRTILWGVGAGVFGVTAFFAMTEFGVNSFAAVAGTVAGGAAALVSAIQASQTGQQAAAAHASEREFDLIAEYTAHLHGRALVVEPPPPNGDAGFDLLVKDTDGNIVEIVEAKRGSRIEPRSLLRQRLFARNLEPSAPFIALLSEPPPATTLHELNRLGITVVYRDPDGTWQRHE